MGPDEKKPYETPATIYSQPLEASADLCAGSDPTNAKAGQPCTIINS